MVYSSKQLRASIHRRANGLCEYCKTPEVNTGLPHEIDHVIPQTNDGETIMSNLALSCGVCNSHKSDNQLAINPETQELVSLFNPRKDIWKEHFRWSDDKLRIIGLSSIGKATIQLLKMNNPLIIAARRIWLKAGWIPAQD